MLKNKINILDLLEKKYFIFLISIFLFALFLIFPALFVDLGLPSEGDAVAYRIPLIQWMLRHGSYPNWPWSYVDDFPMLGEILMLPFYFIKPSLARIIPILAYLGAAFFGAKIFYEIYKENFSYSNEKKEEFFILSAVIWILGLRPLAIQANLLMVDNVATCFCLGAVYFLLTEKYIYSALMLGACMATRYTLWGAAPVLFLGLLYAQLSKNKINLKIFIFYVVIPFIFVMPFLFRNYLLNNGNPLFPFFSYYNTAFDMYGRGKGIVDFLLFPFDLLYTNSIGRSLYDYTLGKLFYLQIVFLAGTIFFTRKNNTIALTDNKNKWKTKFVFIFIIVQTIIWFIGTQQLRMLNHVLILISGIIFVLLFNRLNKSKILPILFLSIFSILSIQKDSILMVRGKKESIFLKSTKKAENCFANIPKNEIILTYSDDFVGFIDRDFIIRTSNFIPGAEKNLPNFNYIYFSEDEMRNIDGFAPWPKESPCILKKI